MNKTIKIIITEKKKKKEREIKWMQQILSPYLPRCVCVCGEIVKNVNICVTMHRKIRYNANPFFFPFTLLSAFSYQALQVL